MISIARYSRTSIVVAVLLLGIAIALASSLALSLLWHEHTPAGPNLRADMELRNISTGIAAMIMSAHTATGDSLSEITKQSSSLGFFSKKMVRRKDFLIDPSAPDSVGAPYLFRRLADGTFLIAARNGLVDGEKRFNSLPDGATCDDAIAFFGDDFISTTTVTPEQCRGTRNYEGPPLYTQGLIVRLIRPLQTSDATASDSE